MVNDARRPDKSANKVFLLVFGGGGTALELTTGWLICLAHSRRDYAANNLVPRPITRPHCRLSPLGAEKIQGGDLRFSWKREFNKGIERFV